MSVEIHRQGGEPASRFPGGAWAEERGVAKEKAFFANFLVATALELRLGGREPRSNFVNEQFLIFVFK